MPLDLVLFFFRIQHAYETKLLAGYMAHVHPLFFRVSIQGNSAHDLGQLAIYLCKEKAQACGQTSDEIYIGR